MAHEHDFEYSGIERTMLETFVVYECACGEIVRRSE